MHFINTLNLTLRRSLVTERKKKRNRPVTVIGNKKVVDDDWHLNCVWLDQLWHSSTPIDYTPPTHNISILIITIIIDSYLYCAYNKKNARASNDMLDM